LIGLSVGEIREAFIYGSNVVGKTTNLISPYLEDFFRDNGGLLSRDMTSGGDLSNELIKIHCVLLSGTWFDILHSDAELLALLLEAFLLDWEAASRENNIGVRCYAVVRSASQG
jgi:hypothetical protein